MRIFPSQSWPEIKRCCSNRDGQINFSVVTAGPAGPAAAHVAYDADVRRCCSASLRCLAKASPVMRSTYSLGEAPSPPLRQEGKEVRKEKRERKGERRKEKAVRNKQEKKRKEKGKEKKEKK